MQNASCASPYLFLKLAKPVDDARKNLSIFLPVMILGIIEQSDLDFFQRGDGCQRITICSHSASTGSKPTPSACGHSGRDVTLTQRETPSTRTAISRSGRENSLQPA